MFKMQKDLQESIFKPDQCSCFGWAGNSNFDSGDQFPHLSVEK